MLEWDGVFWFKRNCSMHKYGKRLRLGLTVSSRLQKQLAYGRCAYKGNDIV